MITAANIPAQSPVYFMEFDHSIKSGATGFSLSELAKIKDRKYSFQILIKLKIVYCYDSCTVPWET